MLKAQHARPLVWLGVLMGLFLNPQPTAANELQFTKLPAGSAFWSDVELCTGEFNNAVTSTIYAINWKDADSVDAAILYFITQQRWDDVWGSGPFRCDKEFEIVDRDGNGCAIISCVDDVTGRAALIKKDESGDYQYE